MIISKAARTAVEAALRGSTEVVAAFASSAVRLYPLAAPTNAPYPFIIYRIEVVGDDTECAEGAEVYPILDVYAREATYIQSVEKAEAIAGACRKALAAPLPLTGHKIDDWEFESDRPVTDPDLLTEHRNVRIRYLTSASA